MIQQGIPLYIVDGYNVIFNGSFSSRGGDIERAREHLLLFLDSYVSKRRVEITVVWDGSGVHHNKRGARRVRSIYTSGTQNADERIIRMVEAAESRGRIIVVSDDRRHIKGVVKSLGAKTMGVRDFLALIAHRKQERKRRGIVREEPKHVVNDLSVDDWMQLFRSKKSKR